MTRLLALVMMMACASAPPQRVVLNYVKAEQTRDYDKAHDLLTTSDQRARPLAAFVKEHLAAGPIWLALAETTRFEVVGVEESRRVAQRLGSKASGALDELDALGLGDTRPLRLLGDLLVVLGQLCHELVD